MAVEPEFEPLPDLGCPSSALGCCLSSCWNPIEECQKEDATFIELQQVSATQQPNNILRHL